MDGELIEREETAVLGVESRIDPQKADYREIWERRFSPRQDEVIRRASGPRYYGVFYGTGVPGRVDFVAGMLTERIDPPPEGLVVRRIPGGAYAVFRCPMKALGETWRRIYSEWLPASGRIEDPGRPALEEFPSESEGPEAPVTIYIAVREA